jgi:heptosyltransferase-2
MIPAPNTRLLVAQTGFLGDVVLTTPLLTALRHQLGPASLTVLTTPQARPLLEYHPAVDHVLVDAKRAAGRGIRGLLRTAHRIRQARFTLAVAPHKSFRTALLLALAGIPRRVGFRQSAGWFLYHHTVRRDTQLHEIERVLCLMRAFGVEPQVCARAPQVAYGEAARLNAHALLNEAGVHETEPVFMVCPGSAWPTKRWTVEGYALLVRRLEQAYGRTLICGGPDDEPIARAVQAQARGRGVYLAGRADLQTFLALIDRARVVVSNDSAPMHLAVARGVPVVAIFCATTPSLGYSPYSEQAVVVEKKDLFCRPCRRHGGPACPRGTEDCMRLVSVQDVLAGIDQLLTRPVKHSVSVDVNA